MMMIAWVSCREWYLDDVGGDEGYDVDCDGDDGDGDGDGDGDDDDDGDDGKCEVETCREWCLFQVWWRGQLWW